MLLIITKILVSVIVVLGLVFISERNPRIGGLLVGLPLGTGIVVVFYAIEQDIEFVLNSVPYGIAGLAASLMFALCFYLGNEVSPVKSNNIAHTLFSSVCGIFGFFVAGEIISLLNLNILTSLLVFLVAYVFSRSVLKRVETVKVEPKKSTIDKIVFRIVVITFIILTITTLADIIGCRWSGILASFPIMLSPMIVILTYDYQDKIFPTVLKSFSLSIISLVLFYICLHFLLPTLGVTPGVIITYIICFGYVYILNIYTKRSFISVDAVKKIS